MAKRSDFNQVVSAKRKITWMEIVGNVIIWGCPMLMVGFILLFNWNKLWSQEWTFHMSLLCTLVLIVTMFVYLKWGRRKIHEQYVADKARAEKHHPVLVIGNTILNLMPFILGILITNILSALDEPLTTFLIVLVSVEAVGRIFLIVDSFHEEEYK